MNFFKNIWNKKQTDFKKLEVSDFKYEKNPSEVTLTISQNLLDLLHKDGYGKNTKVGTSTSMIKTETWETTIFLFGSKVLITYYPENSKLEQELPFLKSKLEWISMNKKTIELKIASDLLNLLNEEWLDDNQKTFTEEKFIKNFKLIGLNYKEENEMDLLFCENGMFGNHQIEILLDASNQLDEAQIQG